MIQSAARGSSRRRSSRAWKRRHRVDSGSSTVLNSELDSYSSGIVVIGGSHEIVFSWRVLESVTVYFGVGHHFERCAEIRVLVVVYIGTVQSKLDFGHRRSHNGLDSKIKVVFAEARLVHKISIENEIVIGIPELESLNLVRSILHVFLDLIAIKSARVDMSLAGGR